ncbi:Transmembrane protein 184 [Neolecta irregularis DAH-3]|uniref:Transmembrane protein 184 n=1 Tax=Neolecta irregularis (strain DAH-3) TaxID=1198029 RepID=A0A1U7LQL6_NEOID|nr:Transmembrane protein 184 [Neolecta irregularis DAH-3]|eukprot:OLL24947.1 Transmembrane protein 184 [Neolecta irregularis DAH-3]
MAFNSTCPAENTLDTDQSLFWSDGPNWDAHRIGWALSGIFAAADSLFACALIYKHLAHYRRPEYQRYYIRIILMIPIYAIVSWLGYRFYRYSTYFRIILSFYEAIVISSFFILLLNFLGAQHSSIVHSKPKQHLVFPLCCWRFNPKNWVDPSIATLIKFVIIAPILAIVQVILLLTNTLCPTSLSLSFGYSYVTIVNTLSISLATYALIQFYIVIRKDIDEFKPLWKFIAIKAVVFLMFYQQLGFEILVHFRVITATRYWTTSNIVSGLNAFCITIEMSAR